MSKMNFCKSICYTKAFGKKLLQIFPDCSFAAFVPNDPKNKNGKGIIQLFSGCPTLAVPHGSERPIGWDGKIVRTIDNVTYTGNDWIRSSTSRS